MSRNIVVLGASKDESRYSNLVVKLLKEKGENVFPVNPKYEEIEGYKCYESISDITERIHTITIYINPKKLDSFVDQILQKKPDRVIFNPETEREDIEKKLLENGINVVKACSIVLLKTNRF